MSIWNRMTNPVLANEWKLRARSRRSAWMLTVYLLVIGVIVFAFTFLFAGFLFSVSGGNQLNPNQARTLFIMLSVIQFAMICFITPGLTSGVISGERERQTLDLLLTTNSSTTKIILGKWVASLSFMLFLVLASIPLYSIMFLFGGIAPQQLVQVFVYYVISMFALGSMGVLFSTLIKRTGVATVLTYASIFVYTIFTFIGNQLITQIQWQMHQASGASGQPPSSPFAELLLSINPIGGLINIFEPDFIGQQSIGGRNSLALPIDPYVVYVLFFSIVTVLALSLAIYVLKPVRRFGKS